MNRKTLIAIGAALIIIITGIAIAFYYQSLKIVTFDLKRDDLQVALYRINDGKTTKTKVSDISTSGKQQLTKGNYSLVVGNAKYDTSPIDFNIDNKDISVTVDPNYSNDELSKILSKEIGTIEALIKNSYPSAINGFTLSSGNLYKEGQWYGTTLVQKVSRSEDGDVYRTILKNENGTWKIIAKPALILSAKEYPDIPIDILHSVNGKKK